jgi:uncharacterized protein (TIGR02001 family)
MFFYRSALTVIFTSIFLFLNMVSAVDSLKVSGDISLVSTYVWRGIRQFNGVAMQGSVNGSYAFLATGVWYSTVNFGDGSPVLETDPYIKASYAFGDLNTAFGADLYTYDFTRFDTIGTDFEYDIFVNLGYKNFGLNIFYTPEQERIKNNNPKSLYWFEASAITSRLGVDWTVLFAYGVYSSRFLSTPKEEATGLVQLSVTKAVTANFSVTGNYSVGIDGDMKNHLWIKAGILF